ncbi:MAG: hypothetical protein NTY99_00965 [DPANN group archaeon]|nr:hypothetical protein [DPANN group archaeon]
MAEEKKEGWMRTRLIIEMAGSPMEKVYKAMLLLGEKFGEGVSDMKVRNKSVREPLQIKGHDKGTGPVAGPDCRYQRDNK